jgi:hypothetical protein
MEKASGIEWQYTPRDAFEAPYTREGDGYRLTISDGTVEVTFLPARNELPKDERFTWEALVQQLIRAREMLTHRKIDLRGGGFYVQHENGTRSVYLQVQGAFHESTSAQADVILQDSEGKIVRDSRAERIEDHRQFFDSVLELAPEDAVLRVVLNSYSSAVADPTNEFLYLGEIIDAISVPFGTLPHAERVLGIRAARSRLGRLANNERVEQSRHRGKFPEGLRKATAQELADARNAAREMVRAYVAYLNRTDTR